MYPRITVLLFLSCPALWTPPAAGGDMPIRTDRYGDPLPPGVVVRLGTQRLTLSNARFLTFSPDGRYLAAHNGAEDLHVWDVATGKVLIRLTTPSSAGSATGRRTLAFSPDSKAIAFAHPLGTVRLWEVVTGKELHDFGGLPVSGVNLAFSPDGRYLFAGGYQAPIRRWDRTGDGAPKRYGNFCIVDFLAVSRDGKSLTAATRDQWNSPKHTLIRWDTATGKEIGRRSVPTEGGWPGELSTDGGFFAVPDKDGKSIALLDPITGRELARARDADYRAFISFSADGTAMACIHEDGTVRVWDTATGKMRPRFKALSTDIHSIALSRDGKRVALAGGADDAVHVWDVAAGRELHSFAGHRSGPLTIAFLKGGKEIVTVSRDAGHSQPVTTWADWSFRRWDAATGIERAATPADPKGEVRFTAFSADGRRLATVMHDGTLHLWDVESGNELRSWKAPNPAITEPAFSPDGKTLLAAEGPKIHRWEVATGRELPAFEIAGASRSATWCRPSTDGKTLLIWTWNRHDQVLLLDATSGEVKRRLPIRGWANQPAFSPDGRTLAVDEPGAVSLWEVANGQSRGRLVGPRTMFGLTFSRDGRFLAIGTDPGAPMSLWDLATGRVAGQLRNDFGRVKSLAFSPDGSRLAVAGYFPTALVCDVAALCGKKNVREIAKIAVPSAEELEGLWAALSGADGARAYRAIRRLGLAGSRGADFLKARLKGHKPPDEKCIAQLIADLDDDTFAVREKASAELGKLGVRAETALRRTLKKDVSAEVRVRIKRLLQPLDAARGPLPTAQLVRLRAVEALEANGSKEARLALTELADGPADDPLTSEAKASLARLRSGQAHLR